MLPLSRPALPRFPQPERFHNPRDTGDYSLEKERQLVARIKVGDSRGAREILNQLLGKTLLGSRVDLPIIKVRLVELFAVVSRAVIDGGGNEQEVLSFNTRCFQQIMELESATSIYTWITPALEQLLRFLDLIPADNDLSVVQHACRFLAANYAKKLTINDIAREVHISPNYLCRLFRKELSISVMEYLMEIRIDHAKRLLENTGLKVADVGHRVGFVDSSHFSRVFRRYTGLTPSHYQQQFRRKQM